MYYEPRQDRKVATVVDTKCAEDVLMEPFFMSIKAMYQHGVLVIVKIKAQDKDYQYQAVLRFQSQNPPFGQHQHH